MNILFEINHPGQVHLLRHTIRELSKRGHKVTVIAKNDRLISYLLNVYGIAHRGIGDKGVGLRGKIFRQLIFNLKTLILVYKQKLALGVGSSVTNDHVSLLSPLESIHLSDDDEEIVPLITRFSYPFSKVILSPDCLKLKKFTNKNIRYASYHELAYLHPNRFKPAPEVVRNIGLAPGDKYFILRFVALKGHHDTGHIGIAYDQRKSLIKLLKSHGRIFITSEKQIEPEFEKYRMPVAPENIHTLMYYATLFLGDSQTMTSEAAMLGTPAIKCNTYAGRLSVPNEIEHKYDLCYSFPPEDFDRMVEKIEILLRLPNLKEEWQNRRKKMLADKIDLTAFMVWFVENYPGSIKIMKKNPEYQLRFK